MSKVKLVIYGLVGVFLLYNVFFSKSDSEEDWVTEEVAVPSEGLITTVQEMDADIFKIEDEVTVPTPEESRIVAKYLDGNIDTFTLDEARLVAADSTGSTHHRRSPIVRAATAGFFGFMMGRSMGATPSAGAYMDQNTYNRVSNTTGSRINQTATRTTVRRPSGKSGFGSGRSTRSIGG